MNSVPPCRAIKVIAFRGDQSHVFAGRLLAELAREKRGQGPGPSHADCILYTGHAGVSVDSGVTFFGFSPDRTNLQTWQLLDTLKNGEAVPGVVRDDTGIFAIANQRRLAVARFEVVLPAPRFGDFMVALDRERLASQYSYGFPNGDGDCNCVTWLERLGLPLLSGRMSDFIGSQRGTGLPSRRFGRCM